MDRQSEAVYQWTDNQKLYINGQTIRSCISMDRQSEVYINGQTSEAVYQWTDNQKCISMDRQSEAVYQWTDNDKNKKTTGKTNDLQNTTQKTKY
jgi:hypothetical protein